MRKTIAATLGSLVFLLAPLVTQDDAKKETQDPKPAEKVDPEILRIRKLIERAEEQRKAGKHEDAKETVRQALDACLALPELCDSERAQDPLWELASIAYGIGDWRSASDSWQLVLQYRARTLPDDHPSLQEVRNNLAAMKQRLGDLPGALVLSEKVYEVRSRKLPDDHPRLQSARDALAAIKSGLGNLRGALALRQEVYEVCSRTLPDDHPDLQAARVGLAVAKKKLGDLRGAMALEQRAYDVYHRSLPNDHPLLQVVRSNLATTKRDLLGDFRGALALQESVYEVRSRTLPDDHPDLQAARVNLAATKKQLGDLPGALALEQKAYDVLGRTLPADHRLLQITRLNLAVTMKKLGDLNGALKLEEKAYGIWASRLRNDHPLLQQARGNLALTRLRLGDLRGALELQEKIHEIWASTLPDDHPLLQQARGNLALTKRKLGDLPAALKLNKKVYATWTRVLPEDHPWLQSLRGNLSWIQAVLGNAAEANRLAIERGRAARQRLTSWALSPRELGVMSTQESGARDLLLTLTDGIGPLGPQKLIAAEALLVSQTLRGIETRADNQSRRARTSDPDKSRELAHRLRAVIDEITLVAGETVEGDGEQRSARMAERSERLASAVREKESLQRALVELAKTAGGYDVAAIGAPDLAAALPGRSAAVAIVGYMHYGSDPDHQGGMIVEQRLGALALTPDAKVQWVPIGQADDFQVAIEKVRATMNARSPRGLRPAEGAARSDLELDAARQRLGKALMAPVLATCGPIDTLYVAVDDLLELVPLDALQLNAGQLVGDCVTIRSVVSLFDLLDPIGATVGEEPVLLAVGGLDYGRVADGAATTVDPNTAAPVVERSGAGTWVLLPSTTREADGIAKLFGETFAESKTRQLADDQAGKAQLTAATADATFLHLATHGYFAPESVKSTADQDDTSSFGFDQRVSGLSPLVLCGLALSGANLPPDDLGRHAGIITAEEILSLDLSNCYLVTLSACDTSLGVRRAGQGYASLRSALQGAGARYVLTSLWKVGDEATMELMVDFYRRLWVEKKDPHEALWEAKMAARKKGMAFRDWAGWVMTGR